MIVSIYQYSWFLFAYAFEKQYGWSLTIGGHILRCCRYYIDTQIYETTEKKTVTN